MSIKPVYRPIIFRLLVALFCTSTYVVQAQWKDYTLYVEASVVDRSTDTLKVIVHLTNQFDIQYRLEVADSQGNIKYLTPLELQGFSYVLGETYYQFQSVLNPDGHGQIFLRKIFSGRLDVFEFQKMDPQRAVPYFYTYFYFRKTDWLLPAIREDDDAIFLLPYFTDCPSMQQKIKEGLYETKDILQIMSEYTSCEEKDPYEFLGE
jgi:hypothetical protein